ncbi:uncharacterized protein PFL1_05822 [Pseudozyma flocculosa PF-1]|uniref:Zn(2)-C6 fungal-type domain-containing protein n=1 Tax=Pseudozyma flocculosa PF-1 TaxID=1277687 RepID=A0A061H3Q9_9BASI|nr:uncharacterized protein PFL1_05822 [Pseudozyma flocculosa PF-1]EPQ26500.1 hypothetical protein PFL1_05822 [Pseudozyma flocculosa PF-1]
MMMIQELYRPAASSSTVASSHMAVQPAAPRLPPLASSHRATTGRAASSIHHLDIARATDDAETGLGLEFGLGRPQSRDARSRINKSGFTRSRTGCLTCRAQKKKCDEAKPICTRCKNNQHQCRYPDQRAPVYGKARFAMERPPHRIVRTRQGWGDVAAPTLAMTATMTATAMATTRNVASFDRHRSSYVGARPVDTPPDASGVTRENVELRHSPRSTAARHHPYRSLSASMLDRAAGEVDGHSSWKKAQQLGEKIAREPFRQLPPLSSLRPVASKPSPETVANMRLPPLSQPSPKLWSIPALSIPTSPASPPRSLLHPDPRAQRPSSARSSSTTASGNGDGANNKVVLPPISTFDRIIKLSAPRIF